MSSSTMEEVPEEVKALQKSQDARLQDVPPQERASLNK